MVNLILFQNGKQKFQNGKQKIDNQKFTPVVSDQWETLSFLLRWQVFNDTLPSLAILGFICSLNGLILWDIKYIKKFFMYAALSYTFYFSHIWLLKWEYKLFDTDLPLYSAIISYFIVWELHVLFKLADKLFGIRIPFITTLFEKWNQALENQSRIDKKRK